MSITTRSFSSRWTVLFPIHGLSCPLSFSPKAASGPPQILAKCWELQGMNTSLGTWPDSNEPCMLNVKYLYIVPFHKMSVQLLSCVQLWDPMDCRMPGLPVHHQLSESTQTHVHWVSDAIQPSHPLLSPSSPTFNLSQHQGLFQWVSFPYQVVKVLESQLQHQSFQWTLRIYFL